MARLHIEWDGPANSNIRRHLQRGFARAAMHIEGAVIKKISTGQPVRRTSESWTIDASGNAVVRPGGRLVGLDPSKPGEPPKVLYGRLRQSIKAAIARMGTNAFSAKLSLKVGSNVEYARRLEYGFVGQDSLGRNISQAPRPFFRPALREEFKTMAEMILKG